MSKILEFKNVTVTSGKETIFDSLNISFLERNVYTLTGANGCGKSLFLKLAAGLAVPSGGEVLFCGMPLSKKTKSHVSYLPDSDFLSDFRTVKNIFSFYCDFFADFDSEKALDYLGKAKISLNDKIKELSDGTLRKLCSILTLSRKAKFFILDNPTKTTDAATRNFILELISSRNPDSAVLITSTNLADIENITTATLKISNGKVSFKEESK